MALVVSACDLSPNDPACIGAVKEEGPAWIEKTVFVDASIGPANDPEDTTKGWVPANLYLEEGEKIGFHVAHAVNLCEGGRTYTFSPQDDGGRYHQVLVPYTENWKGPILTTSDPDFEDLAGWFGLENNGKGQYYESTAELKTVGTFFGSDVTADIDPKKFHNGWYDTGIEVSGESAVNFEVSGHYKPFYDYFDFKSVYPNYGWAMRANTESGNRKLSVTQPSADQVLDMSRESIRARIIDGISTTESTSSDYHNITPTERLEYEALTTQQQRDDWIDEVVEDRYSESPLGNMEIQLQEYKDNPKVPADYGLTDEEADAQLAGLDTITNFGEVFGEEISEEILANFFEENTSPILDDIGLSYIQAHYYHEERIRELEQEIEDYNPYDVGDGMSASGGRGLFVYIGQEPPPADWFGTQGNTIVNKNDDHSLQGPGRDNFFELFSFRHMTPGYFGMPPVSEDPFKPNRIFLRYAEDYFNRPIHGAVRAYHCESPRFQKLIGDRRKDCTWWLFGSNSPQPHGPESPWVWKSGDFLGRDSYTNNEGGYRVSVSLNCVGTNGRYLEAKVVNAEGDHFFGEAEDGYNHLEYNLLSPTVAQYGDPYNQDPTIGHPKVPASGELFFRVVDEDGNGDGDGNYTNNSGSYMVTVGTYVYSNDVGFVSQFIYRLIIKPIRDIFLGTDDDKGAAQVMFEKITGESGISAGAIVGIIRALILLYITLYAIQFIFGFIKDTKTDFFFRLLRIAIILQLIHPDSWAFFSKYLFSVFIDGSLDLVRAFTSQFSPTVYDPSEGQIMEDPFAFFNVTFGLLGNSFFWQKITALFLSPFDGWIYLIFIFICIWWFFMGVVYAVYIYLMATVALAFLLALAPIFITMGLFERTRTSFSNWLRQLANYAMQPVMLLIALAIFNLFIYSVFYRIASIPICKDCLASIPLGWLFGFEWEICLVTDHKMWAGAPNGPEEAQTYAISFFTVLVFITIISCMRTVSHHATNLAAIIFGGTPTGALSGKEAGLPKEAFYKMPIRAIGNKTGITGATNYISRQLPGGEYRKEIAEKDRKAHEKEVKRFTSMAKDTKSVASKPFSTAASWAKSGHNTIPYVGGAVGAVAGFAFGTVKSTASIVKGMGKAGLGEMADQVFDDDINVSETLKNITETKKKK